MAGRPSGYSDAIAETICLRLAEGESLKRICEDSDMPSRSMVFRWLHQNDVFRDKYAQAKERQAQYWAEEILDIADDGTNDYMETSDGREVLNGEHVQRSKLRIDSRKWLLSKLLPKKYGERVHNEVTGADGGALQVHIVRLTDADSHTAE